MNYVIDLNPLLNVVWAALGIVITAVASVVALRIKQKWGIDIDKKTVEGALQNGLQFAQAKVSQANISNVTVQNKIVADAGNYVINHVPDALKNLGVDVTTEEGRASLREKLEARLAPAIMVSDSSQADMSVATAATIANPTVASEPAPVDVSTPKENKT